MYVREIWNILTLSFVILYRLSGDIFQLFLNFLNILFIKVFCVHICEMFVKYM
jgi:hypothetical protein